jgi:hypothetical protein
MAAKDSPECQPCARQFSFHVVRHRRRPAGGARYTIGVWEGTLLRSICHARSLSGALLALSGELEDGERSMETTIVYPKWSDLRELVERLRHRGDEDCVTAAGHLEELHARLHRAVADLESTLDRLTKVGALIEQAAEKSHCIGDSKWTTVAIPDDTWFRLLGTYRGTEAGNQIYRELHLLRDVADITAQTIQTVDNWLGQDGTKEAAMDALWRLMRILESAGYKKPLEHLEWRGQLIRAIEEAGIGLGHDGNVRVRQPEDRNGEAATGALVKEILQAAQPTMRR